VRQHYESIVSDFCVTALLNLFQYEMLRLQDYLLAYIDEVFEKLPLSNNSEVQTKIEALVQANPDWKRLNLLERQIAELERIKAKRHGKYSADN
jgi:ribosomal protein S18